MMDKILPDSSKPHIQNAQNESQKKHNLKKKASKEKEEEVGLDNGN